MAQQREKGSPLWPAAVWLEKKFWFWFAVIAGIVFFLNWRNPDVSFEKAVIITAATVLIYLAIYFLWRMLILHRIYDKYIAPRNPFKMLPKMLVVISMALIAVVTVYTISFFAIEHIYQPPEEPKLTYSQFKDKVQDKELGEYIVLRMEAKLFQPAVLALFTDLTDGKEKWTYFDQAPATIPQMSPQEWLDEYGYNVEQQYAFPTTWILFQTFQGFTMSIPFFFFLWVIAGGGLRSTMQEWSTIKQATMRRRPPVYFKDIGGLENAIEEGWDFVAMLKNPHEAREFGAKMPKGVLLSGPPGSGKTMFATAIATEAGVPHFFISGSDFGKPLVGLGSETAKQFFGLLKRNAPCIGFIDELDSAVPTRSTGNILGRGADDAVTNTILSELDDIHKNDLPILIIGATNLLSKVDEAAKREGRFDRHFVIQYPGEEGRAKIIKIQLSTDPTPLGILDINNDDPENPVEMFSPIPAGFVDELAGELAKITAGFSGAALGNLNNEARVTAWRKTRKGLRKDTFIAREDFYEGLPRAVTKSHKSDQILDERELVLIALHESGHVYFSYLCKGAEPTKFAFLEPHAEVGGIAIYGGDNSFPTRSQLLARIWAGLGGYIVEKAYFGEVTTGPASDLRNVAQRARSMTHDWGMGEQGPVAIDVLEGQTADNTSARMRGPISQKAQEEAQKLILDAEERMLQLLEDRDDGSHYAKIGDLAAVLREKGMLNEAEIKEIIGDIEQIECEAVS